MLHQKDLFLGFYEPKGSSSGKVANYEIGITRYTKKTKSRTVSYRIDFTSAFVKKHGIIERLSVKFDGGDVYFVFNVPTDAGIPFYKVRPKEDSRRGQTLYNGDLVNTIFSEIEMNNKSRLFFNLEVTAQIGRLDFHKLILIESQI
jgi:hypothetical protein